jgi:hypothetical protein
MRDCGSKLNRAISRSRQKPIKIKRVEIDYPAYNRMKIFLLYKKYASRKLIDITTIVTMRSL